MLRSISRLLLPALLLPLPLAAQAVGDPDGQDTTVYRLDSLSVEARRSVVTVGGAGALEVEVDRLEIPASPTVEEVLREVPGIHLRTNSRGQAEISVRGSESRQVAVLLDGAPLTLAWDARTDVSVLPANALRGVTFTRGLSTVLAGPNVLGGVVELSLLDTFGTTVTEESNLGFGLDQEGGYTTSGSITRTFEGSGGRGVIRAGAGFRDLPGFALPGDVEEPVPTSGGRRLNTDMENIDGFVAARYTRTDGLWGSFSATAHQTERGIAAELGTENARFWRYPETRRGIISVRGGTGERATPAGTGSLELQSSVDIGSEEIVAFESRALEVIQGREDGDSRTISTRLLGRHSAGSRGTVRSAITFADIHFDETVDGTSRDFRQQLMTFGAETDWHLIDDRSGAVRRLTTSVGGVYDRGTTPKTGGLESLGTLHDWGGRVGVSALLRGGGTILHAGVSRRGRLPSLREAFSEALNRFIPNPDLEPETLVAIEAGATTRIGSGELQIVGFRHDLSGAIRRITFPDGMRQRVNSDELESTGVELFLSQRFGRVDLGADLTLQSVELTDPGAGSSSEPENLPEQTGRVSVELPIFSGVLLRGEAEYTGSQFCQDPGTGADVELDDGTRVNASLTREWRLGGTGISTRLRASNLGDATLWDQCGLPRPGRMVSFQVELR